MASIGRSLYRPAMTGLSTTLTVVAVVAGLAALLGLGVGIADGDYAGWMMFAFGIAAIITCMLGRVLIYIALTLDDIAFVIGAPHGAPAWPLRDQIKDPSTPPAES